MHKKLSFFVFVLIIFPLRVRADFCRPVNLITNSNSPFQKIPVYDQKSTNICYAYAASQMVEYYLKKNGISDAPVHPFWMALKYAQGKSRKSLYIGHVKEAIDSLKASYNCDSNIVSNQILQQLRTSENLQTEVLSRIEKLPDPVVTIGNLLDSACTENFKQQVIVPNSKRFNFKQLPTASSIRDFISSNIALTPYPLSISYCAKVWKDTQYRGIGMTSSNLRDRIEKDCEYHESLIVGQRELNGSCQFLVRNTWGDKWRKENQNHVCLCRNKKTGEYIEICSAETHGNEEFSVEACWISDTKLAHNIGAVTFFDLKED